MSVVPVSILFWLVLQMESAEREQPIYLSLGINERRRIKASNSSCLVFETQPFGTAGEPSH